MVGVAADRYGLGGIFLVAALTVSAALVQPASESGV